MSSPESLDNPESFEDKFPPVVVVLDAGAQYVDMISKACERHGYPTITLPLDTPIDELPTSTQAIVVSGGPGNSHIEGSPMPDTTIWQQQDIPSLNICYGMQALALHSGGEVKPRDYRTDGRQTTILKTEHPLFMGVRTESTALFTHGDFVESVPDDVDVVGYHHAHGDNTIAAISIGNHVGVQFHPEVFDDTPQGYEMFGNFFEQIAGIEPDSEYLSSQMERQIAQKEALIAERVGDKHVIAFVSGGVDSVTAAMLVSRVVEGEKLHMYYIDNGYMRDEDEGVIEMLRRAGVEVDIIHAQDDFEQAHAKIDDEIVGPLIDVVNPVHKRRIIGEKFVDIQDDIVARLGLSQDEVVLLQGTNAADRIESGFSKGGQATEQIKEHHNQVQRVRDLNPLEPINDLFKDEIRALATALGLPDEIAKRQPFPGPGTAIRILGLTEDGFEQRSDEQSARLQSAINKFNEINGANFNGKLLPVRSVGVGGDSRSHIEAVAISGPMLGKELSLISEDITNNFKEVANRVVYLLKGDDLDDIEPVATKPDREMRQTLRQADRIAHDVMREMGVLRRIEQMPVVLLPLGSNGDRSIVLRPIETRTHMTVQAMLPGVHLPTVFYETIARRILSQVEGISHVFVDATNKPPGTTEWE